MSRARHKKSGGRIGMKVSGNPDVFKEAEEKTGSRARGGRAKNVGFMAGGAVRLRLDRPGRKAGGRVGANRSPLSTAHSGSSSGGSSPSSADSYGGLTSD